MINLLSLLHWSKSHFFCIHIATYINNLCNDTLASQHLLTNIWWPHLCQTSITSIHNQLHNIWKQNKSSFTSTTKELQSITSTPIATYLEAPLLSPFFINANFTNMHRPWPWTIWDGLNYKLYSFIQVIQLDLCSLSSCCTNKDIIVGWGTSTITWFFSIYCCKCLATLYRISLLIHNWVIKSYPYMYALMNEMVAHFLDHIYELEWLLMKSLRQRCRAWNIYQS